MPITVPLLGQEISASSFGAPVANALNALEPTAWTAATLLNGWTHPGGTTQTVQYRRVGDMVQVRGGGMTAPAGTVVNPAFVLPAGFRPPKDMVANADAWMASTGNTHKAITISPAGNVSVYCDPTASCAVNFSFSVTP